MQINAASVSIIYCNLEYESAGLPVHAGIPIPTGRVWVGVSLVRLGTRNKSTGMGIPGFTHM